LKTKFLTNISNARVLEFNNNRKKNNLDLRIKV
jgi:hypothetical protein